MTKFNFSGNCTINGKKHKGNSVTVKNGKVMVDGVDQKDELDHEVSIVIEGDVSKLETEDGDVTVNGSVKNIKTMSGDVTCGNVNGDVKTMSGDVESSGTIEGDVSTMSGDIKSRK